MIFVRELTKSRSTLRAVFEPVFKQIEDLVKGQIAEVSSRNLTVKVRYMPFVDILVLTGVKAILLVGGLGENTCLYERLVNCHASDGVQVMQVNRAFVFPISSPLLTLNRTRRWSSICRGATLWGLEHSNPPTVVSRLSRYSYGIASSPKYDSTKHLSEDKYRDVDGEDRARDQMTWLLRKVRSLSLPPCSCTC